MAISPGDTLGPYEIVAPLGKGGMGEVYKAHDPRLKRDVAIKVSAAQFSERFEREARAIAALNHPHICQIYDVGPNYLVMEFVEGAPLRGPLPLEKAVEYATQILDALDAAHQKGITHRDLKPDNILVTKQGIKLLDFGLAKQQQGAALKEADATLTQAMTQQGQILGTLQYMSPEQLQGKPADARSDLFSLGCVLYELLTGNRPFGGKSAASVIAAILEREPEPLEVARPLDRVVRRSLAKDPDQRFQTARDFKAALTWALEQPPVAATNRSSNLPWAVVAVLAVALIVLGALYWRADRPIERPPQRFDLPFSSEAAVYNAPALSPDGTTIAYLGPLPDGNLGLNVRNLDQTTAKPLEGTDNALYPFFSPDGEWIAYFADGALRKILAEGGAPVRLCDAPDARGGSWGDDGKIVFTPLTRDGLFQVPSAGGTPQPVTELAGREISHRWPRVLPGSDLILYAAEDSLDQTKASIQIWSRKAHRAKNLYADAMSPRYTPNGHLLWLRDRVLFAAPVDLRRLELTGPPAPVLEDVETDALRGSGGYDVSPSGVLAALTSRGNTSGVGVFSLEPNGKTELIVDGQSGHLRFAPDEKRVVFDTLADARASRVLVHEFAGERNTILNLTQEAPVMPIWAPDGRHFAFATAGGRIYFARSDGSGQPHLLLATPGQMNSDPDSFSPDGKTLVFCEESRDTGSDLWTVALDLSDPDRPKAGTPQPLIRTADLEREGVLSPDGHWLAYYAAEPGHRGEIYVQPFPLTGAKWRVSDGAWPQYSIAWSRNSQKLFYLASDSRIMALSYAVKDGSFSADKARVWSEKRIDGSYPRAFDISADGKRAIVCLPSEQKNQPVVHLTFILNFFDELRRRVPAGNKK